jgi:hypothetical protein
MLHLAEGVHYSWGEAAVYIAISEHGANTTHQKLCII